MGSITPLPLNKMIHVLRTTLISTLCPALFGGKKRQVMLRDRLLAALARINR